MNRIHRKNSWAYLALTFLVLIIFGTILLKLPFVENTDGLTWLDALFTSTSAVCVTGLTVVGTQEFNTAGQLVLLFLMQLGGIGIMALSSSLILFLTGEMALSKRVQMAQLIDTFSMHETEHILRLVIIYTFAVEFVGIVLLSIGFMVDGYEFSTALWYGTFHSVSAFCNAGFSIFDSSLIGVGVLIKYTVMILIILGGLGFYVVYDLVRREKNRMRTHTKIVLISTVVLIIAGLIVVYATENKNINFTDSLFQSITTRTAGFNTVDLNNMHPSTLFFMITLMLIGASPGSTGGGLKTTTAFIAVMSVSRIFSGYSYVVIFGRKIPNENMMRAFAVIMLYIGLVFIGTFALMITDGEKLLETLFEAVSAVGTVGLSLGLSMNATPAGKIILIILMFIGRIGPSTLVLVLISRQKLAKVEYPEERVIIG